MPTTGLSSVITRKFHRYLTLALGVKIKIIGAPNKSSTLFISNHISWLDILIIGQIIPTHFLSMIEVKEWPVAGWLATRAGTLYIHRGGKKSSDISIDEISHVLGQNHNVVIFPEGKTTDGTLRKFHPRLIQSAVDAKSYIQPVAIKYVSGDSILANQAVLFNNDITFPQSLLNIMSQKSISVEIAFLDPVAVDEQSRSEITSYAEKQVRVQLNQA